MEWRELHWPRPLAAPAALGLLRALAGGADAEVLAVILGVPVARVRERIARARRTAVAAYEREVKSA